MSPSASTATGSSPRMTARALAGCAVRPSTRLCLKIERAYTIRQGVTRDSPVDLWSTAMRRYELTDLQWARISGLFRQRTGPGTVGRPPSDLLLDRPRHPLDPPDPPRRGATSPSATRSWPTVFTRFNQWRRDGTWARIVTSLLDELDDEGRIDHDLWCIDASVIRASRAAAGGGKKRSKLRDVWAAASRRNSKSHMIMGRSVARAVASAPRSTSFVIDTVPSWASTSRPDRHTRVGRAADDGPATPPPPRLAGSLGRG